MSVSIWSKHNRTKDIDQENSGRLLNFPDPLSFYALIKCWRSFRKLQSDQPNFLSAVALPQKMQRHLVSKLVFVSSTAANFQTDSAWYNSERVGQDLLAKWRSLFLCWDFSSPRHRQELQKCKHQAECSDLPLHKNKVKKLRGEVRETQVFHA